MSSQSPPPSDSAPMGRGMLIIFWVMVVGLLTWGFGNWEGKQSNPNQSPETRQTGDYREVVLQSNRQHHYVANGMINGVDVQFLLDTGATDVVIPEALAERLNLAKGNVQLASTANGVVRVYQTRLDNLTIGNITLNGVTASINPGMSGEGVLLGMSALRNIEFTQRNGELILRQPL